MGLILLTGRNRGLLDTYSSASGFSLRQIKSNYRECLTIRRSSDSTEAIFGFVNGLVDIAGIRSFCGSGTGYIRRWYNVNGVDHAEQTDTTKQPVIYDNGIITDPDSGRVAIRFEDDSASVIAAHLVAPSSWLSVSTQYLAAWSVYTLAANGTLTSIYDFGNSPSSINRAIIATHRSQKFESSSIRTGGASTATSASSYATNQSYFRLDTANRTKVKIYVNDNFLGEANDRNEDFLSNNQLFIGNLNAVSIIGDIYLSELLFFTNDISDSIGGLYSESRKTWPHWTQSIHIIGDSTIAAYSGQPSVSSLMADSRAKVTVAYPGDTVAQQLTRWNALDDQRDSAIVFIQIGHNDVGPSTTAAAVISSIQGLVNQVRTDCPGVKIVACTMTPAKARYIYVFGETDGEITYQQWLDVNESIRGEGSSPITGVDGRISSHTDVMNDGDGNLAAAYDTGDGVHENEAGRQVIADAYDSLISANSW